ncbi:hypothetical protein [Streptomyces angustmyceticus]|uniref:hypothetical protein n=1 Tax=Streptomyces angustmyceticus TaxID=285578 RepID=UPI003F576EB7
MVRPKGFASVVYGLLVLQTDIPQREEAFTLNAVCTAFPIRAGTCLPCRHSIQAFTIAALRLTHVHGHDE